MADTKVSNLIPITVPSDPDILYIIKDSTGESNKITFTNLLSGVNTSITSLSTEVDTYTTSVTFLSNYYTTLNITPFVANIATISAAIYSNGILESIDDLYAIRTSTLTGINAIEGLSANLSGGLTQSVTTAGGTLNFVNGVLQSVT